MDNSIISENESGGDHFHEEIEERIYKFNGEEIVKKYAKGKFLGKGGFAKCYELKCMNNKKIYAAKIVSKQNLSKQSAKTKLKSEIKIHKSLFHSNIVKFEHVFEDNNNVYILLELCKNKTLNELIKKRKILTELEVIFYLDQILKAVKFMHKNKIIHRDLKLGNLFISENMEIKIGDFGLATTIQYDGERRHTICGTPNYIAPEILEGKSTGHSYEVDFWAIGVIVYTLLIGRPPFETEDVKETYKRIHNNIYSFPNHIFISEEGKDFIKKILITNPADRLNLDGMRNHAFMNKHQIPKSIPNYSINYPPNFQFYRKFLSETKQIKNANDLSHLNDSTSFNKYLNDLREFAQKNIKEIKNNVCEEKILLVDMRNKNSNNSTNNINTNKINALLNVSQSKENHNLLKIKKEITDLTKFNFIENLVDYSSSFGIMYHTNNLIVGIYFNDKSTIHKFIKSEEFFFENKKAKIKRGFNSKNLKDVPSDIRTKLSLLNNYEKYLIENKILESFPNVDNKRNVYVRKIIITEISYIFKLSNNVIQVNYLLKYSYYFLINRKLL
jgi:polo-like kinase 1